MTTYLLHIANAIYLLAFMVKDMMWLRILSITGGTFAIATYALRSPPMYDAAGWDALFVAINMVQIARLLAERRPITLDANEQRLYELVFRSLRQRDYKKLVALGRWETFDAGETVVEKGKPLTTVRVVVTGHAEVTDEGRAICRLASGQFVGEMAYLSAEPPTTAVVATEPVTFLTWPSDKLREYLGEEQELRAEVHTIIGADLVAKLRAPQAAA
ncbi:MAG: cyclic nucleotide-binding domain-containing protein [Deltaproteobacteria bacterium]|nr:cyclic nucleotide-binding domain-containing protein [Deltaproteobacteria bacterium]